MGQFFCYEVAELLTPGQEHCELQAQPEAPILECISKDARRERDRCIAIIWENRGKCASNNAALALMDLINGNT